jgi:hypothetical protein
MYLVEMGIKACDARPSALVVKSRLGLLAFLLVKNNRDAILAVMEKTPLV